MIVQYRTTGHLSADMFVDQCRPVYVNLPYQSVSGQSQVNKKGRTVAKDARNKVGARPEAVSETTQLLTWKHSIDNEGASCKHKKYCMIFRVGQLAN